MLVLQSKWDGVVGPSSNVFDLRRALGLPGKDYDGMNLRKATWKEARGLSFVGADMRHVSVSGVYFDGADLSDARLDGARFYKCFLFNPVVRTMRGATFVECLLASDSDWDIKGCTFRECYLVNVDLVWLNWSRVFCSTVEGKFDCDWCKVPGRCCRPSIDQGSAEANDLLWAIENPDKLEQHDFYNSIYYWQLACRARRRKLARIAMEAATRALIDSTEPPDLTFDLPKTPRHRITPNVTVWDYKIPIAWKRFEGLRQPLLGWVKAVCDPILMLPRLKGRANRRCVRRMMKVGDQYALQCLPHIEDLDFALRVATRCKKQAIVDAIKQLQKNE